MFSISNNKRRALNSLSGNWSMMVLNTLIFMVISGICSGNISVNSELSEKSIPLIMPLAILSSFAVSFIPLLITSPMKKGYSELALRLVRGIPINSDTVFIGFYDFLRSLLANLIVSLIVSIPMLAAVAVIFIIVAFSMALGFISPNIHFAVLSGTFFNSYVMLTLLIAGILLVAVVISIILKYRYRFVYYIMTDNSDMPFIDCIKESARQTNGIRLRLFLTDLSFIGWYAAAVLTLFIGLLWLTPYRETTIASIYNELNSIPDTSKENTGIAENIGNNIQSDDIGNTNYTFDMDNTKYNKDDYPESNEFFDTH